MRKHINLIVIVWVSALSFLLAACSSALPAADVPSPEGVNSTTTENVAKEPTAGDTGDYAFGSDREQIATAIEAAFASKNGKATWEGDTIVLTIDEGDASEDLAGFQQCNVLMHLLQDGDKSVIEFPNGRVSCDDLLD